TAPEPANTPAQTTPQAAATPQPESKLVPASQIPDFSHLTQSSLVEIERLTTGFEAGSQLSVRKVFVFFDAQCPHCGMFWNEAKKVSNEAKFIWIPVRLLNNASLSQGATVLEAADPVAAMEEHEKLLLSGQRGITASKDIASDTKKAIEQNTTVFRKLGAQGVPYIVGVDVRSGSVAQLTGGLSAQGLANALGWAAVQ